MNIKKLVALVLCLILALSIVGCGKSEAESVPKTTQEGAAAAEEPVHLTMEIYDRGNMNSEYGTPDNNKWTRLYHDKILEDLNIDLEYVVVPRAKDEDQLRLMMSAGNEPDIFYIYGRSNFIDWANEGLIVDLTDHLNSETGRHLVAALGEECMMPGLVDGRQYAVNGLRYDMCNYGTYIRKDMVEAVGMTLREENGHYVITPSELHEAMLKIKDAGLADYPIGLNNHWNSNYRSLIPYETMTAYLGAFAGKVDKEAMIKGLNNTPEFKECIRFLNTCYNDGLINPDFALFDRDKSQEDLAAGNVAFFCGSNNKTFPSIGTFYDSGLDGEYVAVELIHEDGTPSVYARRYRFAGYHMVSSNCENVDAAIALLDWLATDDFAHEIAFHGIEGENFDLVDGKYTVSEEQRAYNKEDRIFVKDLNLMLQDDPCMGNEEMFDYMFTQSLEGINPKAREASLVATKLGMDKTKVVPPLFDVPIHTTSDYIVELEENYANMILGSIVVSGDKFDEVFDGYLETYMAEGGQAEVDEMMTRFEK